VPHVEGWWVDPELRRGGIGRALIDAIERWASGQGFRELGSDTLLANRIGREAHAGLGFEPTEQIQYFRKRLR
jgi:aminoglycoside 6'-N-acetyltransferase I